MRMKKIIKFLLVVLMTAMLIFVVGMAVIIFKEEKEFKDIRDAVEKCTDEMTANKDNGKKADKISGLREKNGDCIGYLEIPGTSISYPVMQTKKKPDYYLNHNFNKEYSFYGTPYLSAYCDLEESDNLIIYGHNINGGRMFGALMDYKNQKFFDEHRYIWFTTDKKRRYKVFAVMSVDVKEFKYWKFVMAQDEDDYDEFVDKVMDRAFIKTDERPKYGEQMIMLSTCDSVGGDKKRLVVVGAKM